MRKLTPISSNMSFIEFQIRLLNLYIEVKTFIVSIYVDDIVYTRSNKGLITMFKTEMMRRYVMPDLGVGFLCI